jgi:hydrogenase expression/formation protein HypC
MSEPKGAIPSGLRSDGGATREDGIYRRPEASECIGGVCITCSDRAVEVTVVRLLEDQMAVVDTGPGEETVSVALVTASLGDTILVHAREAIAVVAAEAVEAAHE